MLSRINDNSYKIDLLDEYDVINTFNVSDLSPCVVGANAFNSRSNSLKEGGDDEDQLRSLDLKEEHGFDGPIPRAGAKQMVNEAQSEIENMKPKPKLVNCSRNKKNELT